MMSFSLFFKVFIINLLSSVKKKKLGDLPPPVLKLVMPWGLEEGMKALNNSESEAKSLRMFRNKRGQYSVRIIPS